MSESGIFKAAVKLSPECRAAYLDQACGANHELRREVESLLRAHDQAGSFLQSQPASPPATAEEEPVSGRPGAVIGPYKLLQQIGEGGMGVVYMAEQQQPVRRRVALKIIKPGMDSAQVIARFEAERQALALMDHQNIARVLDAGATDRGQPYFVMELVHGVPITKYCDDNKLSPRQRLELFIPVCQAIQHAHQKGIIHRDIKPSNVLVTMYDDKPVPKVIDFGVAKAVEQRLTEKTLFTQFGALVGTFEYMSPEQAEMNAFGVDTRSDVYSLGVLLYELLTGTTPLERGRLRTAALDELVRLIREEEPQRPSVRLSSSGTLAKIAAARQTEPGQLSKLVRGELDWIVMKSLEKDRTRRYETASGLAQDIERHLKDEPVQAGPPNTAYRLRKFVRRNRGPVLAAALVLAALVAGIVGTTLGLVEAWQQRDQAERARKDEADQRRIAMVNAEKATEEAGKAKGARAEAELLAKQEKAARQQSDKDKAAALFQALRAENARHAIQLELALRAWERHDVVAAERVLGEVAEPFTRTWEQRHLRDLCQRTALPLSGHTSGVVTAAFTGDGQRLVSGGRDGTVKVWDATTGQALLSFPGHPNVCSVALSADGQRLVSGGGGYQQPGEVRVWDAATGKEKLFLKGHTAAVLSVAFSGDGKRIASGSLDHTVRVWDAVTGQEQLLFKGHDSHVHGVVFSPDGKHIASGSNDHTVRVWNAVTGQETWSVTLKSQRREYAAPVSSVAFSPDGQRLVAGIGDGTARVFEAATGQEKFILKGHHDIVTSVVYSADGKRIVSGSQDKTVKVWDAETGQELFSLEGHRHTVTSVAISRDGQRLVSGGSEPALLLWQMATTQEKLTLKGHTSGVSSLAISPDGKRIVTGSGDTTVRVWDAATGLELFSLKGHGGNHVSSVAFSPKGDRIASLSSNDILKVWDVATRKEMLSISGIQRAAFMVAFSPDGQRLVTGSDIGTSMVWDATTGKEQLSLKGDYSACVAFSADGQRILTGGNLTVKVWDAATSRELLTLKGHTGSVLCVAISLDGKRILSGSADRTVKVWDGDTGQELLTLKGHTGEVMSVAISPDGKRIVSGSGLRFADKPGELKVWDVATGQEKLALNGHTRSVFSVAFSADSQRIVSGSRDGTVKVWEAP